MGPRASIMAKLMLRCQLGNFFRFGRKHGFLFDPWRRSDWLVAGLGTGAQRLAGSCDRSRLAGPGSKLGGGGHHSALFPRARPASARTIEGTLLRAASGLVETVARIHRD